VEIISFVSVSSYLKYVSRESRTSGCSKRRTIGIFSGDFVSECKSTIGIGTELYEGPAQASQPGKNCDSPNSWPCFTCISRHRYACARSRPTIAAARWSGRHFASLSCICSIFNYI